MGDTRTVFFENSPCTPRCRARSAAGPTKFDKSNNGDRRSAARAHRCSIGDRGPALLSLPSSPCSPCSPSSFSSPLWLLQWGKVSRSHLAFRFGLSGAWQCRRWRRAEVGCAWPSEHEWRVPIARDCGRSPKEGHHPQTVGRGSHLLLVATSRGIGVPRPRECPPQPGRGASARPARACHGKPKRCAHEPAEEIAVVLAEYLPKEARRFLGGCRVVVVGRAHGVGVQGANQSTPPRPRP